MGTLPLLASLYQFNLVGMHAFKNHLKKTVPYCPNVAIVVPAWNEDGVIATTINRLMNQDYPMANLRIYVVDDASTDRTPQIMQGKCEEYPNRVFHLRREKGGQGKAHTLNHGISIILDDQWVEAMIEFPKLMERPIVVKGNKAVVARPTEKINELLD